MGRRAHDDDAARDRGHRPSLARPGAPRRAGGDTRSDVRRSFGVRRRQGLSPLRVRRLLHAVPGSGRALRGGAAGHHHGVDIRRAVLAPRQVLEVRRRHRRASSCATAASTSLDRRRQAGFDTQRRRTRLQAAPRPVRLNRSGRRAARGVQSRVRGARPHVRSHGRRDRTESLRRPRRCRGADGAGAARAGACSDGRSLAASGRAPSVACHGLRRHPGRDRGGRAVRHARPGRGRARRPTRGRGPTRPASRGGAHQANRPAVLHRGHAAFRGPG